MSFPFQGVMLFSFNTSSLPACVFSADSSVSIFSFVFHSPFRSLFNLHPPSFSLQPLTASWDLNFYSIDTQLQNRQKWDEIQENRIQSLKKKKKSSTNIQQSAQSMYAPARTWRREGLQGRVARQRPSRCTANVAESPPVS